MDPLDSLQTALYKDGFNQDYVNFFMKFVSLCRRIESRDLQGECLNDMISTANNAVKWIFQKSLESDSVKVVMSFWDKLPRVDKIPIQSNDHFDKRIERIPLTKNNHIGAPRYCFTIWEKFEGSQGWVIFRHGKQYNGHQELYEVVRQDLGLVDEKKELAPDRGFYQGT